MMQVESPQVPRVVESTPLGRGGVLLALVGVIVLAFYGWIVAPSRSDWGNTNARGAYYNLLVDGLKAGQLNLKVEVPAGLAALPDPYDPQANRAYRTEHHLHDTSYFEGKIYLYYGITPALVLFGPYHLLTGDYLYNKQAAFGFAALGFTASVLLLHAIWRRYFPAVHPWLVASCALALGFANSIPGLLRTPAVCEVAIACAYAFVMVACLAVWHALHASRGRNAWLAVASLAYGLAVGARPSVLFGAIILLVPLALGWRQDARPDRVRQLATAGAAAVLPILAIGIGLAAYNYLRFGDVFEFGQRYQLAGDRQDNAVHFSLGYVAFNAWLYFLKPIAWTPTFPFVQEPVFPAAPAGHAPVEGAYGIFTNTPVALFAFAALGAWRRIRVPAFRWFLTGVTAVFATSAAVLSLFYGTVLRYQAEFHPPLVVLACVGAMALAQRASKPSATRAWVALSLAALAYSAAFAVLTCIRGLGEEFNRQAVLLAQRGSRAEAITILERALRFAPNLGATHSNLGILRVESDPEAAAAHFARAMELAGPSVEALNGRGRALAALGRHAEAAEQFRDAVALQPDFALGHLNFATMLFHLGRYTDSASHYARAIQLGLDSPEVRQALELARSREDQGRSSPPRP